MQCVFHDVHAISIHALREESDRQMRKSSTSCGISIHALREESDLNGWAIVDDEPFQSTLSVRRATSRPPSSSSP